MENRSVAPRREPTANGLLTLALVIATVVAALIYVAVPFVSEYRALQARFPAQVDADRIVEVRDVIEAYRASNGHLPWHDFVTDGRGFARLSGYLPHPILDAGGKPLRVRVDQQANAYTISTVSPLQPSAIKTLVHEYRAGKHLRYDSQTGFGAY